MRKILLGLVIVLMAIMVTTGCQKKESAASGSGLTSGTALTVEVYDRGTDGGRSLAYDNAWTDWIKQKVKTDLGLDVTFVAIGRWTEGTDIVNMMASASAPDVCYTYGGDMISTFSRQDAILNLAPYIDQYLPDMKKLLGADPALPGKDFIRRNEDQLTGEIFSIPSMRVALAQRNIFIRKDWLTALGLPVPSTMTEYYNTLKAFRDRSNELPGDVGRRVIPLGIGNDVWWSLRDFMRNYITIASDRDRWVLDIHGRDLMHTGFKDGLREMNKWYNEGLIYPDFPLVVGDDMTNMVKSGIVGSISGNWDTPYRTDNLVNADLAINIPGAEFIAIDLNLKNREMMDKVGLQMFIPKFSKNQEGALKYLNWLSKPENYKFLQVGREGTNHILVNGIPSVQSMPAGDPWFMNSSLNIDLTMPLNGVYLGDDDLNARVLALSYGDTPAQTIVDAYAISVRNAKAGMVHQATVTVTQYSQTLVDKADALMSQAIMATPAQFDAVYDAGYRDWLSSGATEVFNERDSLFPK